MNLAIQAIAERYNIAPCRIPEFVPSGIPALDAVTGGIPQGRITEIYGAEDTGKTALALTLAKGNTLFLDAEYKLIPNMGRRGLCVMHPETLEDALNVCRTAATGFDSIVIDSLEALPTHYDLRMGVAQYHMDEDVKLCEQLLSKALPILSTECLANGCTLIIVNQMRNCPWIMFGNPERSTGGRALPYYATLRIKVNRIEIAMKGGQVVNQKLRVLVEKHKYHAPGGTAFLSLDYHSGKLHSA